jgi:hypothetical protein
MPDSPDQEVAMNYNARKYRLTGSHGDRIHTPVPI